MQAVADLPHAALDAAFYFSCDVADSLALLDRLAFVALLLATNDTESELDHAAFIVHRKWNDCQPSLFLCRRQLCQFLLVEEESAVARGFVAAAGLIARLIGRDFGIQEEGLTSANGHVCSLKLPTVGAQRFDLAAEQLDPR